MRNISFIILCGLIVTGCVESAKDSVPPPGTTADFTCTPNATLGCVCPGSVMGVQTCLADNALSPCQCPCETGYERSGAECVNIDECSVGLDDCGVGLDDCGVGSVCVDSPGAFHCPCDDGYVDDAGACVNVDECTLGTDDCDDLPGVVCVDTEPGFECSCAQGYVTGASGCTPDPATYIADVSSRPIAIEISGVGTVYAASGLSRIGWDIEVIETPINATRTHKEPGIVTIPNIIVRGISGTPESVDSLVAWVAAASALNKRSMTINLRGLGAELAAINLYDVQPIDGDTTVTLSEDGLTASMAEMTLKLPTMIGRTTPPIELTSYSPPSSGGGYGPCPAPGYMIEIDGVQTTPCYLTAGIDVPAVDSSDSLYLPNLRDGDDVQVWSLQTIETWLQPTAPFINRRSVSVITRDDTGTETSRVNLYEVWAKSFSFFSPTRQYGHEYLFDVWLVTDWARQG